MDRAALHQRIKYLVEEGGLHPGEKPIRRSLLLGLGISLILLEIGNLILNIAAAMMP